MKNTKPIVIVIEGGLIQSILCEDKTLTNDVLIIDYDVDRGESGNVVVPQKRYYHPGVQMAEANAHMNTITHDSKIDIDFVIKQLIEEEHEVA